MKNIIPIFANILLIAFFILPQNIIIYLLLLTALLVFLFNWVFDKIFLICICLLFLIAILSFNYISFTKAVLFLNIIFFNSYIVKNIYKFTLNVIIIFIIVIYYFEGIPFSGNFGDTNITGSQIFLIIDTIPILVLAFLLFLLYRVTESRMVILNAFFLLISKIKLRKKTYIFIYSITTFFLITLFYFTITDIYLVRDISILSTFELGDKSNIGRFTSIANEYLQFLNSSIYEKLLGFSGNYYQYMLLEHNMQIHNGYMILLRECGLIYTIIYLFLIFYIILNSIEKPLLYFVLPFIFISSLILHTLLDPLFIIFIFLFYKKKNTKFSKIALANLSNKNI